MDERTFRLNVADAPGKPSAPATFDEAGKRGGEAVVTWLITGLITGVGEIVSGPIAVNEGWNRPYAPKV